MLDAGVLTRGLPGTDPPVSRSAKVSSGKFGSKGFYFVLTHLEPSQLRRADTAQALLYIRT